MTGTWHVTVHLRLPDDVKARNRLRRKIQRLPAEWIKTEWDPEKEVNCPCTTASR